MSDAMSKEKKHSMLKAKAGRNPEKQEPVSTIDIVNRGLARRYGKERRFRCYGILAIVASLTFLALMFISIIGKGYSAFQQTFVRLDVYFDPGVLEGESLASADYGRLLKSAMGALFPEVQERRQRRQLNGMVSSGAGYQLRKMVLKDSHIMGSTQSLWIPADDSVDMIVKGHRMKADAAEGEGLLSTEGRSWIERLEREGRLEKRFNVAFFTQGDSREPELAGIWGAVVGSFLTLAVTLFLSFPIGIAAAVYLEEFAPKNFWSDLIEVNINNLAAVPSIVFGLLGLAVFLNFFGLPRSAPLVGGLVLTLMTLPTIIITGRAALQAVPPSIREAALGIGASQMQAVLHYVIPLALPGMLTGAIIGMARALGETAPLLMIGMVAFIVDIPGAITDPATVLPVQIFLWADSPERAFVEKTSAATMILLGFLIVMNSIAVILRRRFERRW
jgi:phosphate transport system permease protein